MEQIDYELGRKIALEHYKVGNWYCFPGHRTKYMKVEKIKDTPDDRRVWLSGRGFETLNGALITPKTAKDECIIYCWAKDYIEENQIIPEDRIKRIFNDAAEAAYDNLFS